MSGLFTGAASMLGFGGTTTLGTNSAHMSSNLVAPKSSANSALTTGASMPRSNASRSNVGRSNVGRSNVGRSNVGRSNSSVYSDEHDAHPTSALPTAPSMRNSASAALPASVSSPLVGGYRKRNKKSKKAKKTKKVKRTLSSRSRRNRD